MCLNEHSWNQPWECVDTTKSTKNCGGCMKPMHGEYRGGQDCTIIPGQRVVACEAGSCVVKACQSGWYLQRGRSACMEDFDEGD